MKVITRTKFIPTTTEERAHALQTVFASMREQAASIDAAHDAGVPALRRLFELCESRDSGQISRVARLLAGLYNGTAYRFDLTDLRGLDTEILEDCLAVLRMDANPRQEVHEYFKDGNRRLHSVFRKFGITPLQREAD